MYIYICICINFFARLFAIYFFLFLSTLHGVYTRDCSCILYIIYTNKAKRNLFACLSGMAGHALYGMSPCFGHTGVTYGYTNLLLSSRNICMCAFVWLPE